MDILLPAYSVNPLYCCINDVWNVGFVTFSFLGFLCISLGFLYLGLSWLF